MKTNDIAVAKRILSLIDLTSLNLTDTEEAISLLCQNATSKMGSVAAVCIYPQFIPYAKKYLKDKTIKIATVANFPEGNQSLNTVLQEIRNSIINGADEIDVVMPYHSYLAGDINAVKNFVQACKKTCGAEILLKVILETGALQQSEIIANASKDVILAGADFIKTSTGKISIGATLEAAKIMLTTIRDLKLNRIVGFKTSGGIRTLPQAISYLQLADQIMGPKWVSPSTFRIGASSLVKDVMKDVRM
jgi:deoxyribose-phosphate aldolase